MAVFKCKMCGGELNIEEGTTVCECEYCGSKQTVPNADNEKKMTLFNRANRLRFGCQFDKASGVYESIIADFPEEAEAYWGLVLCKYGIEYVDDPATGKKIPTCHRSSFESVMEDSNFDLVMEYADAISKRVYREEAKQIEELRKGIIEVSSKEEPYDIFICYKETDEDGSRTLDSVLAQDIYNALTEKGYKVFFSRITLEDKLGQEYEPYIFAALHSAKVMLAVGTQYEYYDAVWVKNEWSRYLQLIAKGEKKTLIPCYKNLDAYDMPKEFARLQAQDMGKVGALQDLLRGVDKILGKTQANAKKEQTIDTGVSILNVQTQALLKRGYMALEDKEFTKANDFFEQVLNNDPECGQAYWGKVLCQYTASNAQQLSETLFSKISSSATGKDISIPVDVVSAAKEADEQNAFSEFDDKELVVLLENLIPEPIQYTDCTEYYQDCLNNYQSAKSLSTIMNSRDYERACSNKDAVVDNNIQNVLNGLRSQIKNQIQIENKKSLQAEKEKEESADIFKKEVSDRLAKVSDTILEIRDKEKAAKEEISEKIKQLENEKNNLKGLFTGKKRKELEDNIAVLKKTYDEIILPKDPGEKPIQSAKPTQGQKPQKKQIVFQEATYGTKEILMRQFNPLYEILKGFGSYPFTADGKKKPIKWRLLKKEKDKALIITEMGIDCKKYNKLHNNVTWETCTLRKWLNNEFINTAFNSTEKKLILETAVKAERNPEKYFTDPGKDTKDRVFLLSIKEAKQYFSSNAERILKPTPYAQKQGVYTIIWDEEKNEVVKTPDGYAYWWLRSPGSDAGDAVLVNIDGSISAIGDFVSSGNRAVRPALWVDFSNLK